MLSAAIVGAGLIGRSWAVVFARAGWAVWLIDPSTDALAAAPGLIREALDDLHTHSLVDNPAEAAARVAVAASLGEAVADADLVQENGPETVKAKRAIFADLDHFAPRAAILASSTSFIPASAFSEGLPGRDRCLVGHPVNPPHLVPVVELCGAPWTAPETIARARAVGGGIPPCRRGRGQPGRPRYDPQRWARLTLVLHGAVRDHRTQRAGRDR